jgi:hypothetical protein
MRRVAVLSSVIVGALAIAQSQTKTARKVPSAPKPECRQGSICFSGEVREGQEFRKQLSPELDFILKLPGGLDIVARPDDGTCRLSSWVANPPLRAHHDTEIDAAYDWTAEQEVRTSPREFRFPTNCADFKRLYDLSETDAEKYFAERDSLAKGEGRLWITDSRVTHSHGTVGPENGAVEWMKFSVEIKLPKA